MLVARVNIQLAVHLFAEFGFGKHACDGVFHNTTRLFIPHSLTGLFYQPARITGEVPVDFGFFLTPCQFHFRRVDDDHVIVINAAKVKLTGRKEESKVYRHFTGYPGGLVEVGATKMRATRPAKMLELAIAGMLPKTKLGKQMYRKLKVYAGDRHPHQAQKPVALSLA